MTQRRMGRVAKAMGVIGLLLLFAGGLAPFARLSIQQTEPAQRRYASINGGMIQLGAIRTFEPSDKFNEAMRHWNCWYLPFEDDYHTHTQQPVPSFESDERRAWHFGWERFDPRAMMVLMYSHAEDPMFDISRGRERPIAVVDGFMLPTMLPGALLLIWPVTSYLRSRPTLAEKRKEAGHCLRCGYDRSGLERGRACPECNLASDTSAPPPRTLRLLGGVLLLGIALWLSLACGLSLITPVLDNQSDGVQYLAIFAIEPNTVGFQTFIHRGSLGMSVSQVSRGSEEVLASANLLGTRSGDAMAWLDFGLHRPPDRAMPPGVSYWPGYYLRVPLVLVIGVLLLMAWALLRRPKVGGPVTEVSA